MIATDTENLSFLKLWSLNTEDDGLPVQRQADSTLSRLNWTILTHAAELRHQVVLQRNVTPQIGHDIVLGRIEMIATRHTVPLPTHDLPVTILNKVGVSEILHRMLAALDDRSLDRP